MLQNLKYMYRKNHWRIHPFLNYKNVYSIVSKIQIKSVMRCLLDWLLFTSIMEHSINYFTNKVKCPYASLEDKTKFYMNLNFKQKTSCPKFILKLCLQRCKPKKILIFHVLELLFIFTKLCRYRILTRKKS